MTKWPTEWKGRGKPMFPICTACTRDETGIDYEVRVTDSEAARHAFEEGEGEMVVWSTRRDFGQREGTTAGGAAFVYAAREQERIAGLWAKAIERAQ
jgi:hypothetical protein